MIGRGRLALIALAVATGPGCAATDASGEATGEPPPERAAEPPAAPAAVALPPTVEEILTPPEADEVYGKPRRCIGRREYRNAQIIDERTMLFIGRRNRAWVNRIPRPCLREAFRRQPMNFVSRSSMNLCERDHVEFLDPMSGLPRDGMQRGPRCQLGRFQEVNADIANALLRTRAPLK